MSVLDDDVERFLEIVGPEPDEIQREMDEFARENGFPHVGPTVGGFLYVLAKIVDARRIYEFGSGYGYSAYWFARALPSDGEIVLTEVDDDELQLARTNLDDGGFDDVARYELGDAMETIDRYDGPFEVVLIDHQKERYLDAFEAVRSKVPPGGVVVADNAMQAGSLVDFDGLLSRLSGDGSTPLNDHTEGVAEYIEVVHSDPDFETIAVPLGSGLAVSYRTD